MSILSGIRPQRVLSFAMWTYHIVLPIARAGLSDHNAPQSQPLHKNKPKWLKTKIPTGNVLFQTKKKLRERQLYTVCEEAKCPNMAQCWAGQTATFMILGDVCTRACRFCNVKTGNPGGWLDEREPEKTAEAIRIMGLEYAVITMVDRDDLADFGAAHIGRVIDEVRRQNPQTKLEFLGGDMQGELEPLKRVIHSGIQVFAHNVETTEDLSRRVRDARAGYRKSLRVLEMAKGLGSPNLLTKSALMLGLGEAEQDVVGTLMDLRHSGVDMITIGQYMRPSKRHLAIKEFVEPARFAALEQIAYEMGFLAVASGPLVRSSFMAADFYQKALLKLNNDVARSACPTAD